MKILKRLPFICTLILLCFLQLNAYSQYLPNGLWKIRYASSEEPLNSKPSGAARLIIDGDKSTFWHSRYSNDKATCPHEIQIDLGAMAEIRGVVLSPRQNSSSGRCAEFEISVSTDGSNWTKVQKRTIFWSNNGDFSDKTISFHYPEKARYLKYVHLKTFDNGLVDISVASLAEIKIKGRYVSPAIVADFKLRVPKPHYLVNDEITLENTSMAYCSDIDCVRWQCPGASYKFDSEKNLILKYSQPGFYNVSLTVSNKSGLHSSKVINKLICILPEHYLDRRNWRIYACSEEDALLKRYARNVLDSLPETYWATSWDQLKPLPHFIVFDLGEITTVSGFGYLPLQTITDKKGLVTSWRFYVSDNGKDWGKPVTSGTWTYENRDLKIVQVPQCRCRYVKFEINKTLPLSNNYASCAEFYIFGRPTDYSILFALAIAVGLTVLLLAVYRVGKKSHSMKAHKMAVSMEKVSHPLEVVQSDDNKVASTQIYLFGDFRIVSGNQNVTQFFTSKLRQLFVMLICSPEGVSIHKMTTLLWPGLPAEKAVNNRSSIIKNLKTVLANIQGVNLEYSGKQWRVILDNFVYCDLYDYNKLIESISACGDTNQIKRICQILERGALLSELDVEWLDDIKERITGEIIEEFSKLLVRPDLSQQPDLILQVADCMLIFDEVNELALKYKIQTLISQHKNSVAKTCLENFSKKYKLFYNQDYSKDLTHFLS